jgi:hypothetical protein
VTDFAGKVFIKRGSHNKCVICDVLFTREASRVHSDETCFPAPPACPPIPYGVVLGEA